MCLELVKGQMVQASRRDFLCSHPAYQLKKGNTNSSSATKVSYYLGAFVIRGTQMPQPLEGLSFTFLGYYGKSTLGWSLNLTSDPTDPTMWTL